jgi:hypothetical protein
MKKTICAAVAALVCWTGVVRAGVLYDVGGPSTNAVGIFDENIMADDVHIERPAVVKRIEIVLAIAGQQQCAVWVFGRVKQDPLHVIPFTNRPAADKYDFSFYSFDLSTEVPKDFYVGLSAQGDGWGANKSDSVYTGTNVAVGIASNANRFFYGPVSVGQLLNPYDAPTNVNAGFLFMTVSGTYRVPIISGLTFTGNAAGLAVTNLFRGETNAVERAGSLPSNEWVSSGSFVAEGDQTNWSETVSNDADRLFYRVHVLGQ